MIVKRNSKILWRKVFIVAILVHMFPLIAFASITDVSGHWAEQVILQWVEDGLANGYPDGTFRPNNDITRAEFMKLVNNTFGFVEEVDIEYTDVPEGQWYYDIVKKAQAAGYIRGYDDGTIRPNNHITREEVATIIARIMNLEDNGEAVESFKDKDSIKWSKGYVGAVVVANYMKGYEDGTFRPQRNITRAEAVYALNNILTQGHIKGIQAIAKQDFFGITYIHVTVKDVEITEVKANDINLSYDTKDGKWKGTILNLEIGDTVEVTVKGNGLDERIKVKVKDMGDR